MFNTINHWTFIEFKNETIVCVPCHRFFCKFTLDSTQEYVILYIVIIIELILYFSRLLQIMIKCLMKYVLDLIINHERKF